MTESRLVRSVVVTAANKGIRINSTTYSLTEGTYYHSDDGTATDLIEAFEDQFQTELGTANFTIRIVGVGIAALTTHASGRLRFLHSSGSTLTIDWDHAGTTIDPAWLGYDTAVTGTQAFTGGSTTYSPYVHRYGWYPQTDAEEDVIARTLRNHVEYTTGGYVDGVYWGEDERISLAWDQRPPALVEIEQAANATRAADVLLTQNDPHAPFERWAIDCASNPDEQWLYYPTATDTAISKGPYRFGPGSPLWTAPLGPPTGITHRAGRYWAVVVDGQEAR